MRQFKQILRSKEPASVQILLFRRPAQKFAVLLFFTRFKKSSNVIDSKHKHANGCAKHQQRGQSYDGPAEKRALLIPHNFAVTSDYQNTDQKEGGEKTIDYRSPKESFQGVYMRDIEDDANDSGKDDHRIKGSGCFEFRIYALFPPERLRKCIGG